MRSGVICSVALAAVLTAGAAVVNRADATNDGSLPADALRLGERIYRDGILPSGEPIRGIVQNDIPIDGSMFSCASCHLRSGVGAIEGSIVTLPTNGEWLYKPLEGTEMTPVHRERRPDYLTRHFRPAYTDVTLARALRDGIDPAGRTLNGAMPRYALDGREMNILVHYLKNLSAVPSPGVTDTELRFATVIADDVEPGIGEAVFGAMQAIVRDHNSQTRRQEGRAQRGPFYRGERRTSYRKIALSRWSLTGPRATWRDQLEEYYANGPVFALLGGISGGDWAPIHEFCESNGIPNLFPITDFPVISDTDWYTVYYSKGLYQEGETVGKFIRGLPIDRRAAPVVQVYRKDRRGMRLSRSLRETSARLGMPNPVENALEPDARVDGRFWEALARREEGAILVLWLGREDLSEVGRLAAAETPPPMIVLSSSLLGRGLDAVPPELRHLTYLTHPHALPREEKRVRAVASHWLKARKIDVTDEILRSQLYFTGWALSSVLNHMKGDFYRDYFLDVVDMMRDEYYSIGCYPRVSFGPGQRYASKGCYIVRLSEDPSPAMIPETDWVIP